MENIKIKILNNALELFSQKGYDAVGVQTICEVSSITKPTLYYHFGSKSGLLRELFRESCSELDKVLIENSQYSPNPQSYEQDVFPVLKKICEAYFAFAKNNPTFYSLMLCAFYSPSDSEFKITVKDYMEKQFAIIGKMFHQIGEVHKNIKRHEEYLTLTFIGAINSCIIFDLKKVTSDALVKQFMHGIFS